MLKPEEFAASLQALEYALNVCGFEHHEKVALLQAALYRSQLQQQYAAEMSRSWEELAEKFTEPTLFLGLAEA